MSEFADNIELSGSQEDYLYTIYMLVEEGRVARVRDIARLRGVKPGSVSPAMRTLSKLGLVVYERREFIALTSSGVAEAKRIARNKQVLLAFFTGVLGLPAVDSESQVCAVEHHLSQVTIDRIASLVERDKVGLVMGASSEREGEMTIADLVPGMGATVSLIRASGELNHQLIDMGMLPDATVRLVRMTSDEFVVALGGFEALLNREQAEAVVVIL